MIISFPFLSFPFFSSFLFKGGDTLTPDIKNYTLEVTVRLITCDHSNIGMFHPVQCPAPAPGSPLRDRDRARIR